MFLFHIFILSLLFHRLLNIGPYKNISVQVGRKPKKFEKHWSEATS